MKWIFKSREVSILNQKSIKTSIFPLFFILHHHSLFVHVRHVSEAKRKMSSSIPETLRTDREAYPNSPNSLVQTWRGSKPWCQTHRGQRDQGKNQQKDQARSRNPGGRKPRKAERKARWVAHITKWQRQRETSDTQKQGQVNEEQVRLIRAVQTHTQRRTGSVRWHELHKERRTKWNTGSNKLKPVAWLRPNVSNPASAPQIWFFFLHVLYIKYLIFTLF